MESKDYDLIIPFGCNCMSASQLRLRNLRLCSFPLDWVAIVNEDCDLLRNLFENRFEDFLDINRLRIVDSNSGDGHLVVQDEMYKYCFVHDFKKGMLGGEVDDKEYEEVVAKYQRRIKRLYSLIDMNDRLLFVCNFKEGFLIDNKALIEFHENLQTVCKKEIDLFAVRFNSTENVSVNFHNGTYVTDVTGMGNVAGAFSWLDRVDMTAKSEVVKNKPPCEFAEFK